MANTFEQPKSDFRPVDWVQKQTAEELDTLGPVIARTAFHKIENGNVVYNMDDVKEYLAKKQNLNWKTLTAKNSGALITAIQIALERMGYDVGKIDGVFANKGSTTSKTKEAVKKFQKDNGLTPDGIPGQKTIAKLVEGLLVFPPLWAFPFKKNPGQQPREVFKK